MSTVAEIAVEYAAKGSKAAVRADRSVRDSIQDTAKSAQSESSTINRWMERHKSAVQMVGMATAGVMGAIISASPTMRSELAGVRMAFSLWADTVIDDVLPSGTSLTEMAFELEDAYRNLPEPVRNATSNLVIFGSLLLGLAGIAATAQKLISGTFVAKGLALIPPAAKAAVGALVGLISIKALLLGGLALLVAGVVAFAAAYILNWRGTRDKTHEFVSDMIGAIKSLGVGVYETAKNAIADFASWTDDKLGGLPSDALSWGAQLPSSLADGIRSTISDPRGAATSVRDAIQERIPEPLKDAYSWGQDASSDVASGISNRLGKVRTAGGKVRDGIQERIPDPLKDAYSWGKDAASDLGSALVNNAFRAGAGARKVGSRIDDALGGIPSDAYSWGRDIISEFHSGFKSRIDSVRDAAGDARSVIEDRLSFDRVENDRAARRWGSDLLEEMSTGVLSANHTLESAVQQPDLQPQPPATAAGGGGSTTIVFERGAIQVGDAGSPRQTANRTAEEVSQTIQDDFGARR